jgi:predicted ester cyclase
MYLAAFPDLHLTAEDIIAEGNKVEARFSRAITSPVILSAAKNLRERRGDSSLRSE